MLPGFRGFQSRRAAPAAGWHWRLRREQRCGVSRYIVRPSEAGEETVASMVERRLHLSSLQRG